MTGCEISSLAFFFLESDKRRSKWSSEQWLEQEAPKEKLQWSGKHACNRFCGVPSSKRHSGRNSQALDSCAMTIRIMTCTVEQEAPKEKLRRGGHWSGYFTVPSARFYSTVGFLPRSLLLFWHLFVRPVIHATQRRSSKRHRQRRPQGTLQPSLNKYHALIGC